MSGQPQFKGQDLGDLGEAELDFCKLLNVSSHPSVDKNACMCAHVQYVGMHTRMHGVE